MINEQRALKAETGRQKAPADKVIRRREEEGREGEPDPFSFFGSTVVLHLSPRVSFSDTTIAERSN